MLPGSGALSQLLGTLYDAAADPCLWEQFLQQLGEKTSATSAALVVYDADHQSYALSSDWQFDPESTKLYGQYYGALVVWGHRALSSRASLVCTSEALCSPAELIHTEIYNDFLTRFDIPHGLFALSENTGSRLVSCSLFRHASRGPFQVFELDILRFLAPHLRRAFKLHVQFSDLRARSAGAEAGLDLLLTGVIFLGGKGQVVFMNRRASEILSERDGLLTTFDSLRAERQADSELLAKAIQQAVETINGVSLGGAVLVSRRTDPPLQVLISPIRHSNSSLLFTPEPICAVAFVVDPSQRRRPREDVLRALFGLTPAECRVALLLGDGRPPREIANTVGVTENTVRSQIKSIFSKTGVKRQAELIRLLLNNAGPTIQVQSGF